jgi:NAD(P)H dehydrogenase (quinone)
MNVFIVFAHPEPKSFNGALLQTTCKILERQGHAVKVSDLYAMNFNPVSSRKNFTTTSDPNYLKLQREEMFAAEAGGFAPDLKAEMDKLLWCDLLLLQFPLWWFGLPAILKGWVDRVFAMGFAYGSGKIYETGMFRGKRAMCSLTTGSPGRTYAQGGLNGEIDLVLFPIQHGMFSFCGFEVLPPCIAYGPAHLDDENRRRYFAQFSARMESLSDAEPIRFDRLMNLPPSK